MHPFAGEGVVESERMGVKGGPGDDVARGTVGRVAQDRVAEVGEVNADLVGAARIQSEPKQRGLLAEALEHRKRRLGLFGRERAYGEPLRVPARAPYGRLYRSFVQREASGGESHVRPAGRATGKLSY